jgi:hypothetical protein
LLRIAQLNRPRCPQDLGQFHLRGRTIFLAAKKES